MLKIIELVKATGGKLLSGDKNVFIKGISIDSRALKRQEVFLAIRGNNFDGHSFIKDALTQGASCVISETGNDILPQGDGKKASPAFIKVTDTIKALGDIARYQRNKFNTPVIAVTGSNGKTTTKEMIAFVLSEKFKVLKNIGTKNNHIGLPQTLVNLDESYDACVLEAGTNHFGEVSYLAKIALPDIAVITNIGPSHLEFLKNEKGVLKEKYTLVEHLKKPGMAILNSDDKLLNAKIIRKNKDNFIVGFGIKEKSDFQASAVKILKDKTEFLVSNKYKFTLKTIGYSNIYNALVAIAVARVFGLKYQDIARRLIDFKFPQSRLNFIELNSIKFIDDTYNSNPLSLRHALSSLDSLEIKGRKVFVMGDMLELGQASELFHRKAGKQAAGTCDIFITVGPLSKIAASAAKLCGFDAGNIFTCDTCLQARDILFKNISLGSDDVVLVKGSRSMRMEEILKEG